ncbi:unnamed protein product [Prorocentrum cordatum]|uniref:AP2/ERF domain-containing protein n=1 Tax=Prorocentrum cordatum TaxID=2364126 RepID=A0ABN9U9B0_9DINO|nr:unnamed protein product [Polarella glacialis]
MEEEDRLGQARAGSYSPAEGQSGVKHINWVNRKAAWRITYKIRNGPDQGRKKQLAFRPKDESPEEVEQARLAAVEALRRLEEDDLLGQARVGQARAGSYDPPDRQSGVKYVHWVGKRQTWCVRYVIKHGPGKGTRKQPIFRPKDDSPEEVEQARLAAVEALRELQEEDCFGRIRSGQHSAERQSGVQHIHWDRRRQLWRVQYRRQNGPDEGIKKQPIFRPKDGSPEEVERARLAAVQALRGLQEGDRALAPTSSGLHKAERQSGVQHIDWDRATQACGSPPSQALQQLEEEGHALEPSCSGRPCANRGRGEVPLLDGLFLVVGEDV